MLARKRRFGVSKRSDIGFFLVALLVTVAMAVGIIYFVREILPILPGWASVIFYVLLAVIVIGYPIYTLARWSDRYLTSKIPTRAKRDHSGQGKD
jgi:hypothetical protein